MSMCSYCSTIPMNLFSSGRKEQCHHDHQPSYNALEASALLGCPMCKFLLQAISVYTGPYAHKPFNQKASWKEDIPVTLYSTKFNRQTVNFAGTEAGVFRGGWIPDDWHNVQLSLISTADFHINDRRYLALSHCWGLTMPDTARTVTTTLEKHKTSIQEAKLSRTFRDFVEIARRLRIQYVWIDSLCIIQDDAADWEKESSQMASVYSNAYLTIAASSSADGSGGCAVWDSERSLGPLDVDCVPMEADFAPKSTNYKFRVWTRNPSPTGISNDPLQTRGWTLQERELSPRVVNYCKDTIRWECRGLHASLEFPWDDSLSFNGVHRHFDAEQSVFLPMPGVNRPTESPTDPTTKIAVSWMELIVKYTSRRLTKDSDKLPAISGIARTIAEKTSDEYFAGLWKSYFQQCLLWQSDWTHDNGLQTHTKPLHNTAPSWSWASINGKVAWPLGNLYAYNPDPDPEFIPKILDIHIDPLGSDPYGMLKQGILHLEGKVTTAFSLAETDNGAGSPQHGLHTKLKSPITQQEIGWIRYDIPLSSPVGKPNIIFLMCCLNDKKRDGVDMWTYALALQPVLDATQGTPGTVRRVGLASRIRPDFWKSNTTLLRLKIC
ncbi:hypothetical protein ACMFMG_000412 [Clarireedia jacksonii]